MVKEDMEDYVKERIDRHKEYGHSLLDKLGIILAAVLITMLLLCVSIIYPLSEKITAIEEEICEGRETLEDLPEFCGMVGDCITIEGTKYCAYSKR